MGADAFVEAWVDRGYDLIAITDHNDGIFVDEAVEASTRLAAIGKHIRVLPGVELTVSPGVHILAIFGDGGSGKISDLLSALGMQPEARGSETSLVTKSFEQVWAEIHERNGFAIAAHCNSTSGLVHELEGQPRFDALRRVDALEHSTQQQDPSATITYVRDALHSRLPFVFGSDSHNPLQMTEGMWVKMARPDFNCLRQILFEPELRISMTQPAAPQHPRILGCTTTHGIYPAVRFGFSPNLNVVIGGRGAGKSALIDLIRFALGAEPDDELYAKRIAGFLESVGEVLVLVKASDGREFAIVRSGAYAQTRNVTTFTSPPIVYLVVDEATVVETEWEPSEVFPAEFYGQGEVSLLTRNVFEQLRLIDDNLDLNDVQGRILAATEDAQTAEAEILDLLREIEERNLELADLPELIKRQTYLTSRLTAPVFQNREGWQQEQAFVNRAIQAGDQFQQAIPSPIAPPVLPGVNLAGTPNPELIKAIQESLGKIQALVQSGLANILTGIQAERAILDAALKGWSDANTASEVQFRAQLLEDGVASLAALSQDLSRVGVQITTLNEVTTPERNALLAELEAFEAKRSEALAKLIEAREDLRTLREGLVQSLNDQLGGVVRIDFADYKSTDEYFDFLDSCLTGSGMINRQHQLAGLCEKASPVDLTALVRAKNSDSLCETGLTESAAVTLIGTLGEEELLRLERIDTPQMPRIMLRREGESIYTDLSRLSVGEMCSAILSIALVVKTRPLVIDQPEDELDHAFVTQAIVENLRSVKRGRQVIAATHNPNIPVLGDAEMVFRVSRRPGAPICEVRASGGLEEPSVTSEVQMLEGGPEAFERRRLRYSGHATS